MIYFLKRLLGLVPAPHQWMISSRAMPEWMKRLDDHRRIEAVRARENWERSVVRKRAQTFVRMEGWGSTLQVRGQADQTVIVVKRRDNFVDVPAWLLVTGFLPTKPVVGDTLKVPMKGGLGLWVFISVSDGRWPGTNFPPTDYFEGEAHFLRYLTGEPARAWT